VERPLRIGLLGTARITTAAMIEPVQLLGPAAGVELAAVGSRDAERAAAYAAQHGIARSHGSYEALVEDPDVDAVYNPLPNSLHEPWSIAALAAGKAVLCEKPLADNTAEAARMVQAARRHGRPLVEAVHYRYHPFTDRVVELVSTGAIGRLRSLEARFWVPAGRVRPDNIRFRYGLGGGATMDIGCYCIHAIRLLGGGEPVVRSARPTPYSLDNSVDGPVDGSVDVAMEARLELPGGVAANIDCSLSAPRFDSRVVAVGDEGELEVTNLFQPQRGNRLVLRRAGEELVEEHETTPTFAFQLRAFADTVTSGRPSLTPGDDAIATMRVIDDVYRAAGMRPRGE
jgi:predicted dehydrogenase